MKKYIKPTLNIEVLSSINYIANSASTLIGSFGKNDELGDKTVDFSDFGTGEWN